jgi:hypothetical protein
VGAGPASGMQQVGKPCQALDGRPPDRAQRNFTDPDSRILPTRDGLIAGYNGWIAVDAAHGVIVSQRPVASGADIDGLVPLLDAAYRALSCKPVEKSADTGFVGEATSRPWPCAGSGPTCRPAWPR